MKIAVLGVGTVGIMSICHALRWLCPHEGTVTSIYDPSIPIFGIGETTQPGFLQFLYEGTNFTLLSDGDKLDATFKLGGTWNGWRNTVLNASLTPPSSAMHFNNHKLKDFCFERFEQLWGNKFNTIEGSIESVTNIGSAAQVSINHQIYNFDFLIDCRGAPTNWSEYNVINDFTVNRCLLNIIDKPGNWNTTINQAHSNGWMFGIPLKSRQGWGYLFNDNITSEDDAILDIEKMYNTSNLELKDFKFRSYYAHEFFDGRILKNGNRALFFEPLEGTAGYFYETVLRTMYDYINHQCTINEFNNNLTLAAIDLKNFVCYVYQGGSNFESNFWNETSLKCKNILSNDLRWSNTVMSINRNISTNNYSNSVGRWSIPHWLMWDTFFGYNTFIN
jgi:hypothetical protein